MSGRKNKQKVMELLSGEDVEAIKAQLSSFEVKDVVHGLFSGICSSDEKIHWNAVACMGPAVARLAEHDLEEARIVIRRMLWSLNDESGGIGWGAPEAMAEIMVHHQALAEEYIHMLISYMREDGEELFQDGNYLEHEVLQRGLLWGVTRLAETKPDMLLQRGVVKDLIPYLCSTDDGVRSLAARGLGLLGADEAMEKLQPLQDDNSMVRLYIRGKVHSIRVCDLATEAIKSIMSQGGH